MQKLARAVRQRRIRWLPRARKATIAPTALSSASNPDLLQNSNSPDVTLLTEKRSGEDIGSAADLGAGT